MNSEAAPATEDETDDGAPKRKPVARRSRRMQSRVEARRRVGNYRVIAMLGEGGMAQVHLAVKHGPAGFKKLLVVKSMRDDLLDPIYVRSFMHEARLAAQLNHPNVIQTYEVGEDDGQLFIAMEYVEGQSMRAVQRRLAPKRLPMEVQLRILAEIARGLHHAHTLSSFDGKPLQIVHRDVSPQNVMLTYDGQVRLLDFGIAKAQGSDELTREGMIKGKIDYMAPEQLRGDAVDQRADVFALGVMLWEALTGLRFSGGAEVAEITKMHNRIMGREQKLRNVAPDTPMRLVEICEQAIAIDPKDRFATAEAFERAIHEYLAGTSRMTESQQLSQIMETLFASEREKMRLLVEEQLRLMDAADVAGEEVEVLLVEEDATTGTPSAQDGLFVRRSMRPLPREEQPSRPPPWRIAIASGIVAGAVLAGVFLMTRDRSTEAADPDASSPAATSPSGVGARAPSASRASTVQVRIEAAPATATATLDGVPIELPFDARLAHDADIHRVEVRAEGYRTDSRSLTMSEDVTLRVALEPLEVRREPRAAGRASHRSQAVAAAPPSTTTAFAQPPAAPSAPSRAQQDQEHVTPRMSPLIESSNPYE